MELAQQKGLAPAPLVQTPQVRRVHAVGVVVDADDVEMLSGDAAEQVAAAFDAVDLRSAEAVGRVNHLLSTAAREAEATRLAAERAQYQQYGPYGPAAAV